LPASVGAQTLYRARLLGDWLGPWPWWAVAGALIGALPCLLEWATNWPCAKLISSCLLTPLLVAAVARDSLGRALAAIATAFAAHSAIVIALAACRPEVPARTMPAAVAYWQESHLWITTGMSREYDLSWWLPAHLQWLAAVSAFTYLSLGLVTFWQ